MTAMGATVLGFLAFCAGFIAWHHLTPPPPVPEPPPPGSPWRWWDCPEDHGLL